VSYGQRQALAALSGLLLWLSFPNPWALGFEAWTAWLAWAALLPLLAAIEGQEPKVAAGLGCVGGLACFVPGLAWLTQVRPLGPGALPAWLALAAWCSLFAALFAWGAARGLRQGWALPVLWIPALWTLTEALREVLLSGFPWMGLGSSQYRNPALLPLAAALGQTGLHYAVALGNAVLYGALIQPRWLLGTPRSLSALGMALALAGLAQWQAHEQWAWSRGAGAEAGISVAIVQGAIDQDQAWNQAYRRHLLDTYFELSRQAVEGGAELLLWPESSFPGFFNEDAPEAREVKGFAARWGVDLLIGSTLSDGGFYTNSAVWIDAQGSTRSYAKRHLVPFGEYVPFRRAAPLLDLALERIGVVGFSPGQAPGRFEIRGTQVKPLICYESIFPRLARSGGTAGLLAVLTVDTWYGRTAGPVWHASQSALRAVEQGTWLARAAATGISLFAAPDGQLIAPIPLDAPGWRVQRLSPPRVTPFQRFGDIPLLFACLLMLVMVVFGPKRLKTAQNSL
jgi:apolipoprotein N-acyltransferase